MTPTPTREELTLLSACAMRFFEDFHANLPEDVARGFDLIKRVRGVIAARMGEAACSEFFGNDPAKAMGFYRAFHDRVVPEGTQTEALDGDLVFFARAALLVARHIAEDDIANLVRGLFVVDKARTILETRMTEEGFERAFGAETLARCMCTIFNYPPDRVRLYAFAADMKKETANG